MPIAGELVRERPHVAGPLHVVLAAQRVHADAVATDIAARHRQVRHAHHHRRTLAVFGHPEAVIDGTVRSLRVEAGSGPHLGGRHASERLHCLGAVLFARDELRPLVESLAPRRDERLVNKTLGHHHMRHGIDDRYVRAWVELEVVIGRDVRRANKVDAARVDDDELGALAQPLLHSRGEHRMPVGGVRADHHDDVGLRDRLEVLGAGRLTERLLEPVTRRRVADPRAGVDVVVAERGAHHLLDDVDLFVGAARRGDAADRARAVLGLDLEHPPGDVPIASSHSTSRHGSVIFRAPWAAVTRSGWVA